MGAKKGSYETAVLKAVAKCGALTAYEIAKEILKDRETREIINREGEGRSGEVLAIYPIVLKAVKRLVKNELLAVVKDGDKKKYGLSFKGLIYLEPNYQEIKGIIEKNRESLFSYQSVQYRKEIRTETKVEYITDRADCELNFLLQILTNANETDYSTIMKFIRQCIEWKKESGENIIRCVHALLYNYELFEKILQNAVKAIDSKTKKEVFNKYTNNIISNCLSYLECAKACLSNIIKLCEDQEVINLCKEKTEAIKRAQLILI